MYAVVEINGKQYKVKQDDELFVDRITGSVGDQLTFDKVMLLVDRDNPTLGTPYVKDTAVFAQIVSQDKLDKIRVSKFKAKVRYRRTTGFRHSISKIKVLKIGPSHVIVASKSAHKKRPTA